MGTKVVGQYNRQDMAKAMEALTGRPAVDIIRVIVEPHYGTYSSVEVISKVFDTANGKLLLDGDGELVLRNSTFTPLTGVVQDVFKALGIGASDAYSVDSHITYTEHGKYVGFDPSEVEAA